MNIVAANNTQIDRSSPHIAGSIMKAGAKMTLSGVYLISGLSLIALGAYSCVYSSTKLSQFYFDPARTDEQMQQSKLEREAGEVPQFDRGFGSLFQKGCNAATSKMNLASGPSICEDLSQKCWQELRGAESIASSVAVAIIGEGSILFLSSYCILAGFSLLGRSFNTFVDAI